MDIAKTIKNLNKNGMDTYLVETKSDALNKVKELLNKNDTVAVGGSVSLGECGVLELLRSGDYNFLDRYEPGLSPEQLWEVFVKSNACNVYLCSSNAITEKGELYNVDGNSNRVSAIAHGPKSVIMIVGVNKIVKDLPEAIERVKKIAAPLNCKRLNCNTYCTEKGFCASLLMENPTMTDGCASDGRICCNYLISAKQRKPGRIKIILVNENLGY